MSRSADPAGGALVDADWRCPLAALPDHFAALDARFAGAGVAPGHAVVLACPQSARGAVALLYLLARGRDVVLLPDDLPDLDPVLAGLRSCRFVIGLGPAPADDDPDGWGGLSIAENPGHDPASAADHPSPRLYVRTSGSMGQAKLVCFEQAALVENARLCVERFGMTAGDRVAIAVPIAHMYGLGAALLPAALAGASCDLIAQANLLRYMDRERQFEPDVAFLTPALCDMMVRRRRQARPHRLVVTAGARIAEATFRAFDARFGPLVNLYGSSEMGAVAVDGPDAPIEHRATALGAPLRGVALRLAADGEAGRTGELECRHPHGFLGYFAADGSPLAPAPDWFPTRDRVARDEAGALRVLGRVDNAVNRDGRLVMFADIEAALEGLDGVEAAIVVRAPGESRRGPNLMAWCVPAPGAPPDAAEAIHRSMRGALPPYAVPDRLGMIPSLPRLASGKPDRQQLTRMTEIQPPEER